MKRRFITKSKPKISRGLTRKRNEQWNFPSEEYRCSECEGRSTQSDQSYEAILIDMHLQVTF